MMAGRRGECIFVCVCERKGGGVKLAIWCPLVYMYHTTMLFSARVVVEVFRID